MRRLIIALVGFLALAPVALATQLSLTGAGPSSVATIPSDVTLPVASTPVGAVAANAFTGWTNLATSVSENSDHTSPTTNIHYITQSVSDTIIATTVGQWRDVEVTTYAANGCAVLRYANGAAVTFRHVVGVVFMVNIETGVTPGNPVGNECLHHAADDYLRLYETLDPAADIPGYNTTATQNDTFTFGCSGVACYAKFNGVEFWNSGPNIDIPMAAGAVAVSGYAVRETSVHWLPLETLYGNPTAGLYDVRDYGLKTLTATGSITGGTNSLVLTSNPGFVADDKVIIQIGGETGMGQRGTKGVGGTQPALSYANDAAMEADHSQPAGTYAWLLDSGKVRSYNGSTWAAWQPDSTAYYYNMAEPLSLVATVTGVSGNTLTLDTNATVTATNATVYFDNVDLLADQISGTPSQVVPVGITLSFPTGYFAVSSKVLFERENWDIAGAGVDLTKLISPLGVQSIQFWPTAADNSSIHDLTFHGNIYDEGFGFLYYGANSYRDVPTAFRISNSDDFEAYNLKAIQSPSGLTASLGSDRPFIHDSTVVVEDGYEIYLGSWGFNFVDTVDGLCEDCTFTSPVMMPGMEAFGYAVDTTYRRCVLLNGGVSSNGGDNTVFDECSITIEPNVATWWTVGIPIVNFNTNASPGAVGEWKNGTITQEGLFDGSGLLVNIAVNSAVDSVTISGTYKSGSGVNCINPKGLIVQPDWTGGNSFGGVGVRTAGDGTVISGMRFVGMSDYAADHGNVHTEGGSGKTVTVTNNIMDHAATGNSTIIETGTISNATYEGLCP